MGQKQGKVQIDRYISKYVSNDESVYGKITFYIYLKSLKEEII